MRPRLVRVDGMHPCDGPCDGCCSAVLSWRIGPARSATDWRGVVSRTVARATRRSECIYRRRIEEARGAGDAFVPPRTEHWVENALAGRDLQYLYISVWPNGIPSEEFNGGWKHVYAGIIDEYVTRGFPIDGKK